MSQSPASRPNRPLVEWNDSLRLGVPAIDEEHRVLVDLLNQLHAAMKAKQSREVLGGLLTELIRYTDYHFSREEALLQARGYRHVEAHLAQHRDLREKTQSLAQRFVNGEVGISIDVMEFLGRWLQDHINVEDRRFVQELNSASGARAPNHT